MPFIVRSIDYQNSAALYVLWVDSRNVMEGIDWCRKYGLNTIHTWFSGTGGEFRGMYDMWSAEPAKFFSRLDSYVSICKEAGVYLVATMITRPFAEDYGAGELVDTTSDAYAIWKRFAQDVASRYKDEPQILFWEIVNEYAPPVPYDALTKFYRQAAADIRAVDPNHLISPGVGNVGFDPEKWRAVNKAEGIDISGFHIYEGESWDTRSEASVFAELKKWADLSHTELGKPIYIGELGANMRYDNATKQTGNPDNPVAIWEIKSLEKRIVEGYSLHYNTAPFFVVPDHNPGIINTLLYYFKNGNIVPIVVRTGLHGTTDPSPGTYLQSRGEALALKSIPEPNYVFGNWLLDGSFHSTEETIMVTADEPHIIHTVFTSPIVKHELTIAVTEGGASDPSPGTYKVEENTSVTVKGMPNVVDYKFDHWVIDAARASKENPIIILMNTDHSLLGMFVYEKLTPISPIIAWWNRRSPSEKTIIISGVPLFIFGIYSLSKGRR